MATTTTRSPALEERQTRVVTQTLTRPSTTITAVVTLGSEPAIISTLSPNSPTIIPTPTSTTSTAPVGPATPSSLTNSQLGAILGSVLGFAFLVLLFCCCCLSCRRRRPPLDTTYTDYAEYESDAVQQQQQQQEAARTWNNYYDYWDRRRVATGTWTTRPPPVRFPPTPRYYAHAGPYHYRQTSEPQIPGPGVRRYH
ncbi:uncharacterized protein B0T15DRAFT_497178 [Chaetomium strumarium]|uniref:Uncharacterized protein n=1 Tax=Chaetomium strumarium TaxID=1170767 RepID=A0AAJ0GMJ6_9PEZI|nr:hypothetical protein B0T15DRAFT_497178 [Chaetomium strumarium]